MVKDFSEMNEVVREVTEHIENEIYDCKQDCKNGLLSGSMIKCVSQTVTDTMDKWTPRLSYSMCCEVLDWFQHEYGLYL